MIGGNCDKEPNNKQEIKFLLLILLILLITAIITTKTQASYIEHSLDNQYNLIVDEQHNQMKN